MAQDKNHRGLNLDLTDAARIIVLRNRKATPGLMDSEKEELKKLEEKGRQAK